MSEPWEIAPWSDNDEPYALWTRIGDSEPPTVRLADQGDCQGGLGFATPAEIDDLIARLRQARDWLANQSAAQKDVAA